MDWTIEKNTGMCAGCEKSFREEEVFYSCLVLNDASFVRRDFCENCWHRHSSSETPESTFFSFWKTRIPRKDEPKRITVNSAAILTLFLRLEDRGEHHDESWAKNLRYVLALFLMRKRLLKLENQGRDDTGEFMELYSADKDKHFRIHDPELGEEEITRLNDEVLKLFDPSTAGQSTLFELAQNTA